MKIIVTNDDGIYSPGLACLAKVASQFGEVVVVAPDVEQSSMGHAITATRPLLYRKAPVKFEGIEAYKVNGTPADCVALGTFLQNTDVVLSGINMGYNLGNSMWHSGTLAAAKQAVLLGVRGIALSTSAGKSGEIDFESLEPFVASTLETLFDATHSTLSLINVNFPPEPKDIQWTRQSVRLYDGKIVPGMDPIGRKHYWYTFVPLERAEDGTDRRAIEDGYISVTPLRLDLTNEEQLSQALRSKPLTSVEKV